MGRVLVGRVLVGLQPLQSKPGLSRLLSQGFCLLSGLVTGLTLWGDIAVAQRPFTNDPSQIRRELEAPPPPSRPVLPPTVPRLEEPTAPPGAEDQPFFLQTLSVTGSTVYSPERLQVIYAPYLNRTITLKDLYAIAYQITQLYRNDGYILSQAIVPEQVIQGGVVRIQVIEGYIDQVKFEGASSNQLERLQGFADRLTRSRPLQSRDLERYLLLMNDLAGFQVQAVLSPGPTQGSTLLTATVKVDSYDPFIQLTNRGAEDSGPLRLLGGIYFNSLRGGGERWSFSGAVTPENAEELQFFQAGLNVPIGSDGLRLDANGSYTSVRPSSDLDFFKLSGENTFISLSASYPIRRSRNQNLFVSARFDFNDTINNTDFIGIPIVLSSDQISALRFGVNYNISDRNGTTAIGAQISQGLPILGATTPPYSFERPPSRIDGSAVFTKLNLDIIRQQILPKNFNLLFSGSAQVAANPLLVSEQFALGGANCNSAYPPAQVLGDAGFCARTELQRPIVYPFKQVTMISQPYLFADVGRAFLYSPTVVESGKTTLASTGLGLRQFVGNNVNLQLELAFPLLNNGLISAGTPQLFFTLQGSF